MKKLVLVSIVVALLLAVSVAAMADATNWIFRITPSTTTGMSSANNLNIGWFKNYTDGVDTTLNEVKGVQAPAPGTGNVAAVSILSDGQKSIIDYRQSLALNSTLPKIWTVAIFTQGAWTSDTMRISFVPIAGANGSFPATDPAFPPGAVVKFTGAGINNTWTVAEFAAKTTTWYVDLSAKDANGNFYTEANPYLLTVMVPEPSSMLALASGLAGLVGFGIRRRKA